MQRLNEMFLFVNGGAEITSSYVISNVKTLFVVSFHLIYIEF